jgi:hypothetical protein
MTDIQILFDQIEQDYKMLDGNFRDSLNNNICNKISPELSGIFESHKMALTKLNKQRNDLIKEMIKLLNC